MEEKCEDLLENETPIDKNEVGPCKIALIVISFLIFITAVIIVLVLIFKADSSEKEEEEEKKIKIR